MAGGVKKLPFFCVFLKMPAAQRVKATRPKLGLGRVLIRGLKPGGLGRPTLNKILNFFAIF